MSFLEKYEKACADNPERRIVFEWLLEEMNVYSSPKFGRGNGEIDVEHDEWMRDQGYGKESEWLRQVLQYADRAAVFGITAEDVQDGLKGRQAAMKMSTTLVDSLASMIRVHGLPPAPGHTSGEVEKWER